MNAELNVCISSYINISIRIIYLYIAIKLIVAECFRFHLFRTHFLSVLKSSDRLSAAFVESCRNIQAGFRSRFSRRSLAVPNSLLKESEARGWERRRMSQEPTLLGLPDLFTTTVPFSRGVVFRPV